MEIDAGLVRRLVREQHPRWSDLPVTPVEHQGNDNRTFRLGEDLAVRLPSHGRYVAAVAKEDTWLPALAAHLAVDVPVPVASGRPSPAYPFPWSVRRWLHGTTPDRVPGLDRVRFVRDVGALLRDLRTVPADGGPAAGEHCFHRGRHPGVYDAQVQQALDEVDGIDVATCRAFWADALATTWPHEPVWFHGDVAVGNLLVREGRLSAVIDLGTCGVGDPACDLVLAWTFLRGEEREVFREAAGLDDDTWRRARGWALWKALVSGDDATLRELGVRR